MYRSNYTHNTICEGLASSFNEFLTEAFLRLRVPCECVWQGALALLDIETGVETVSELEAGAAFLVMLLLTSADPKRV
jgi:hypothetical protein